MRLFIADKFWDQFIKLPKLIQKKVIDFQRKFQTDPKSAAINLESIHTFIDPNLRTARIDINYRAVIGTTSGDNFYLIWVDNHDEAMDWAKNKIFEWNSNTQAAQIFSAPEEALDEKQKPALQEHEKVGLFKQYSDEQLLAIGIPEKLLPSIRSILTWKQLEASESILPSDSFENLFYVADGANIEQLIYDIEEGKQTDSENAEDSINNKRFFIEFSDELVEKVLTEDIEKWQIFLHASQRKIVEGSYKGPFKVTGGAGTGKTVAAVHRLNHLCEKYRADRILFCTFTNALAKNLMATIQKMDVDFRRYELLTIDKLVKTIAKKYNIIDTYTRILDFEFFRNSVDYWNDLLEQQLSEFDAEFLDAEYKNVILQNNLGDRLSYLNQPRSGRNKAITRKQKNSIWYLVEMYISKKREDNVVDRDELFNLVSNHLTENGLTEYKHTIVDEVQDLSNTELRFLRSLIVEGEDDLFLVGDPYQSIYSRRINFSDSGINVRGKRSKKLRINYRTSEEIKKLAIAAVSDISYDDFDGEEETLNGYISVFHGEIPTYELFKTKGDEYNAILAIINDQNEKGISNNDIVIACRLRESLKEIKTKLHNEDIPYYDVTSSSGSSDGVHLSTLHNLKGLEFKVVILSDINNRTAPYKPAGFDTWDDYKQNSHIKGEKSLLYVAISRGIYLVKVLGTGIKSELVRV